MKARHVIATILTWLLCDLLPLCAASSSVVPARFRRITSAASLTANAYYVLADAVGTGAAERVCFLSSNFRNGDESTRKLKGAIHDAGWEEAFECTKDFVVWQCIANADGSIALRSVATGLYLSVVAPDKLGLQLSTSASATLASWQATDVGDERIRFSPKGNAKRALSADEMNGVPYAVFDNYAPGKGLVVYKKEQTLDDAQGTAVCPADGQNVAITCGEMALADNARSTDISRYALINGKLTADAPCLTFECQWEDSSTGEPQHFRLHDNDKGLFLSATATLSSEPATWQVVDGKLATKAENGEYIYLVTDHKQWTTTRSKDDASATFALPTISTIEALPTRELSAEGTLTLNGGWSALRLKALEMQGANCLDLTHISLPRELLPFDNSADTPNFPIFVAAGAEAIVSAEWQFVAVDDGLSAKLLHNTRLADRQKFFTDRTLYVEANQLFYERDGLDATHWQTLCLPFHVSIIPENVQAIALQSVEDGQAVFAQVSQLEAGRAYLIRKTDASDATTAVRFTSAQGIVATKPDASSSLRGSYEPFAVTQQSEQVLMLKNEPSAFFPAKAGSHIAPFRAFLNMDGNGGIRSIRIISHNRE